MRVTSLLALAALQLAGAPSAAAAAQGDRVSFAATCAVEGAPDGARCGILTVDEDRRPGGRTLRLRFVLVPGRNGGPGDPILYIAGGPGESAVEGMPAVLPTLRGVDADRPILFLDQRGTGASNPLHCPGGLALVLAPGGSQALSSCRSSLGREADLAQYSSLRAAEDIEALRAALGYSSINLVGVSYGVRVALVYMRDHPRRVRTAILRSAYPIDYNIIEEGAAAADAQLELILADCEADSGCRRSYPQLRGQLRAVMANLENSPAALTVPGSDGNPSQILVTRDLFNFLMLVMMQSSVSRQYVPLLIATAAEGGLHSFAVPFSQLVAGLADFPVGMYLSTLCAEDAPRLSARPPRRDSPFASIPVRIRSLCSAWPVPPAPGAALAPFTGVVPTLIISGALDPVTPPEAAERLAASLRGAAHAVLPATAHGPMFPDCIRPVVTQFIRSARHSPHGSACAATALSPFAPRPGAAAAEPAPPAPLSPASPASVEGSWDLEWQTSRGSSPGGHLVIRQQGSSLEADLHGRGSIRATGEVQGSSFTLRGSRLFVSYTLTGTVEGDRMEGTLRVMSVERRFTGRRRPASGAR